MLNRLPDIARQPGRCRKRRSSRDVDDLPEPSDLDVEDLSPKDQDMPPAPDPFPDGWDENGMSGITSIPVVTRLPKSTRIAPPVIQPVEPLAVRGAEKESEAPGPLVGQDASVASPPRKDKVSVAAAGQPIAQASTETPAPLPLVEIKAEDEAGPLPNYLVPPVSGTAVDSVHMITVVMRSSGDKTRDVLRVRRIYGLVMSYPGSDRFAFHVFERGQGYLVEFPNFTTGYCSELVAKLQQLVGADNIRIDKITFQ